MLDIILIGLAALCAGYFVVITIYGGIGTSFAFIWLFLAALCLFLTYGKWYYARNTERIPRWLPVAVVTTCVAGMAVFAVVCILVFLGAATLNRPGLDYVIVLGARVNENTASNSLKKRLDKAIEYVQENPDTILVVSGGNGGDGQESEAKVMYDYLIYNGIRPEQLLMEDRSVSTVENIAFSWVVIENHRRQEKEKRMPLMERADSAPYTIAPDRPLEVGVLTSNYHIYRARLIAEKWGIENVYGISTSSDPILFVHFCVRECASIIKDRLMGNM